jgi:RND family efflux transporter MFP subunit
MVRCVHAGNGFFGPRFSLSLHAILVELVVPPSRKTGTDRPVLWTSAIYPQCPHEVFFLILRTHARGFLAGWAACCAACACCAARGEPQTRHGGRVGFPGETPAEVTGLTAPTQSAVVSAVMAARIAEIPFPEGARVVAGDIIVALDDAVQAARTEMTRLAAESTLYSDLARVRRDDARREWERIQSIGGRDLASSNEVAKSRAAAEAAELEYEIKKLELQQAVQAYERELWVLGEYRIRAPFSGLVIAHLKQPGETVDELDGIVQLTALDPLRVDLDCPVALAAFIRAGDRYEIRPLDPQWPARVGVIKSAAKVADGASQTFKVKLEVPNADERWLAGLKVSVNFANGPVKEGSPAVLTSDRAAGSLGGNGGPK